ncbi:MAG: Rpn family recombination-promoting nuclease/putative transposase [Lachnospiraceae bacterium]|nr:Rpn family recombination-promoting nuclease/putative transposase [Lachnospiraceae bacterium]
METPKRYEELRFTDDFMFCKIMTTRLDICKDVLELILGFEIKEVKLAEAQKSIEMTSDGKGIRLDVYVDDDENMVYDIEMQTTFQADIAKRSRYYQGMIDLNLIERGALYKELKKSFIIFICMERPFRNDKNDLPIYTFKNVCMENKDIVLSDEAAKVFLNVSSERDDIPESIKEFFEYLKGNSLEGELNKRIEDAVSKAVAHTEWRSDYMTLQQQYNQKYAEGLAEGLEKGRIIEICNFVREGYIDIKRGAEKLGISEEKMAEYLASEEYQ